MYQPFQPIPQQQQFMQPASHMGLTAPSFKPNVTPFHPQNSFQPFKQMKPVVESNVDTDDGVKYTCRYDIQIDNEKEFQVARRVIGSKGSNMKRIIEESARGFDSSVNPFEVVKLRLRGKGSGFKEGPQQEESEDPLNLCISSKYKEKYEYACNEVETLLKKVYEEYFYFYQYKTRKPANWGSKLEILKEETVTRPKVLENEEQQTDNQQNDLNQL